MPEGDTVWLAAQRMDTALHGALLRRGELRVPQLAAVDLTGAVVTEVVPRGKHMLIRLADGRTLRTHYRMDGSWHIYRPGSRWRGGPGTASARCWPPTSGSASATACTTWRWCPPPARTSWSATWAPTSWAPTGTSTRRCAGCAPHPDEQIGVAILDQRNLAGPATSTRSSRCSSAGSTRGRGSPTSPTCPLVERAAR